MLKLNLILATVLIATISFTSPIGATEKNTWKVKTENFLCVLKHLNTYKKSDEDPVVIYLDACPVTDFSVIIKKLTKNSAVPSIDKSNTKTKETKNVITYLKDELICLENYVIDKSKKVIDVPVKPCSK